MAMDQVEQIMAYEQGDLDEAATLALFADLVKSGLAWQLQGHYGRQARALIDGGYLDQAGNVRGRGLRSWMRRVRFYCLNCGTKTYPKRLRCQHCRRWKGSEL